MGKGGKKSFCESCGKKKNREKIKRKEAKEWDTVIQGVGYWNIKVSFAWCFFYSKQNIDHFFNPESPHIFSAVLQFKSIIHSYQLFVLLSHIALWSVCFGMSVCVCICVFKRECVCAFGHIWVVHTWKCFNTTVCITLHLHLCQRKKVHISEWRAASCNSVCVCVCVCIHDVLHA